MDNLNKKLDVKQFSLYYGDFRALREVDLDIPEKRITAIIGPSGCGKSTFLRSFNRMNDLIPGVKITGDIRIDGDDLESVDVVELRKRVGMVFQRPNPFPKSIFDNVAYGPRMHGITDRDVLHEIVERSLKSAVLWDEQRLCIARALAVEPEVILMDEPASALDPIATLHIEELIQQLKQEYTIVIVTHNMQQAARSSDYTAFFNMGEDRAGYLVEFGPTEVIFTNPEKELTEQYITGRFG